MTTEDDMKMDPESVLELLKMAPSFMDISVEDEVMVSLSFMIAVFSHLTLLPLTEANTEYHIALNKTPHRIRGFRNKIVICKDVAHTHQEKKNKVYDKGTLRQYEKSGS